VLDYIEPFYNPTHRHSTLGYVRRIEFEEAAKASGGIRETGSSPMPLVDAREKFEAWLQYYNELCRRSALDSAIPAEFAHGYRQVPAMTISKEPETSTFERYLIGLHGQRRHFFPSNFGLSEAIR
jgi:transposase InsO family protein